MGKQVVNGPIVIIGVGEQICVCEDGIYSVCLPLYNGRNVVLTGLCLPNITNEFPIYDLKNVEKDIWNICKSIRRDLIVRLAKLRDSVGGGNTNILIGTKYTKYFLN